MRTVRYVNFTFPTFPGVALTPVTGRARTMIRALDNVTDLSNGRPWEHLLEYVPFTVNTPDPGYPQLDWDATWRHWPTHTFTTWGDWVEGQYPGILTSSSIVRAGDVYRTCAQWGVPFAGNRGGDDHCVATVTWRDNTTWVCQCLEIGHVSDGTCPYLWAAQQPPTQ